MRVISCRPTTAGVLLAAIALAGSGHGRAGEADATVTDGPYAQWPGAVETRTVESLSSCPPTGLCVVHSRSRYRVEGGSDRQLTEALRDGSPAGAHALTDFGLTLSYDLYEEAAGCRIDRIAVQLEIQMQLPRLADDVRASAERRARWRHAREGLNRHEHGHIDIALEHAERLLEALHDLPTSGDCRAARRVAGRQYMRLAMRHSLAQQIYDLRTGSGARQGAVIAFPAGAAEQLSPYGF